MKQKVSLLKALAVPAAMVVLAAPMAILANGEGTEPGEIVDFETSWDPDQNSYQIDTLEQLQTFRDLVNSGKTFSGVAITLGSDIDLSSIPDWTPIGGMTPDPGMGLRETASRASLTAWTTP